MYSGEVIKAESLDPEYKVKFSFSNEKYSIQGIAIYRREYPNPRVTFNDYTDYFLERHNIDSDTIKDIKLNIGRTVCDYLFKNMDSYSKRF